MTQQEQALPFLLGPQDAETACLLIHGFSGTPAEMRGLGEALADQQIRAYGMSVTGHTGNPEALLDSGRKEWIASAEEALSQLGRYRRLFVAGLSMGGVLALILAIRHPSRISGVITLSTPTRFTGGWQVKVVPLARYFIKWFYPLERLDFADPTVQEEVLKQARLRDPNTVIDFSDPQLASKLKEQIRIPVPAIAELFQMTNETRKQLHRLHRPLLIIHSKHDPTVNPECADELYRLTTGTSAKSLHWLEQPDHVVTTGAEHKDVYRLVLNFINASNDPDA